MRPEDDIQNAGMLFYEDKWHWFDAEYLDEGICGPFDSALEALLHAYWCGYNTFYLAESLCEV